MDIRIHKSKEFFQIRFVDPTTGKLKRKRFRSKKEAELYRVTLLNSSHKYGTSGVSDIRVSQALESYLKLYPHNNIRYRKNHFTSFVETFGAMRLAHLRTADLTQWLTLKHDMENLSWVTVAKVKAQFNPFFVYLHEEGFLSSNLLSKVKIKTTDKQRRPRVYLSVDEVHTILDNAKIFDESFLYPYLYFLAHTGARRSEILKLKRSDVDFNTGMVEFRQTKNGKDRRVNMSSSLKEVISKHLDSHKSDYVFPSGDTHVQRGRCQRSVAKFLLNFPNGKHWTLHSLRHSFANNFLKTGNNMYQLQAILGHSTINMTIDTYGGLQAVDIENPSPY